MTIFVTGGAGFIGSNFVRYWLENFDEQVVNIDVLTYAGNLNSLKDIEGDPRYIFSHTDIGDHERIKELLTTYNPRAVLNFAAESHVDRSIHSPRDFINTNVLGTCLLLQATHAHWVALPEDQRQNFRFLHVSTDEVYGSLQPDEPPFSETNAYQPNSPYSASKAASDHFVRAYFHTYAFPTLTTNCSNNYGPYQFPEKLIPLVVHNALREKDLPIYGDGKQVRDWLYVEDHCRAIAAVLAKGRIGETYNIGGDNQVANLDLVSKLCELLDIKRPREDGASYKTQIRFVKDRPGHDRRYAIDPTKIRTELNWQPFETWETGLERTIDWYLANDDWVRDVTSGAYRSWLKTHYNEEK